MKCPKCSQEISTVKVLTTYMQIGTLKGADIVEYSEIEGGETYSIRCPLCGYDIGDSIEGMRF